MVDGGIDEETWTTTPGKSAAPRPTSPPPSTAAACGRGLMDNFRVEVDVQSYLTIVDGRKVYQRGKTWDFAAGRDLSVAQITGAVEEQFRWSADQRMTIWYGSGDDTVPLISESEIAQLFDKCKDSRIVRFGVTIESKSNESARVEGDEENDEPVHAPFFAWPNQAYAGEYEDDEPVQYEEVEEKPSHVKAPENVAEVAPTRIPLGRLDVENSYDEQNVPGDDESILANNVIPIHISRAATRANKTVHLSLEY